MSYVLDITFLLKNKHVYKVMKTIVNPSTHTPFYPRKIHAKDSKSELIAPPEKLLATYF